jgi:hypothetical protein
MSDDDWQDANSHYLTASLHWLRLKLGGRRMPEQTPAVSSNTLPTTAPEKSSSLFERLRSGSKVGESSGQPLSLPAPNIDSLLEDAAQARANAADLVTPPALVLLARCFGLTAFERDVVLLCVAAELDPDFGALSAAAPSAGGRAYPTFALALQMLDEPTWEALAPHRPLRYLRMLELNQPGSTPLTAAGLRVDERIVNFVKGLNVLDERLTALLSPVVPAASADAAGLSGVLAPSQQTQVDDIVNRLHVDGEGRPLPTLLLLGIDVASKHDVAFQVGARLNRHLYRVALQDLPGLRSDLETVARLWQRENLLLPLALYIDAEELDVGGNDKAATLQWLLGKGDLGLVFVGLRERPASNLDNSYAITITKPTTQEQRDGWASLLADRGTDAPSAAALLAGQFDLSLRDIALAARQAKASRGDNTLPQQVWQACCNLTRPRLDLLAQRIEARATWDDLVLPAEALGLLRQITSQVRGRYQVYEEWGYAKKISRGLGISVLFSGESGTGKTMAAEVLANDLGLALYRIDLSAIVSKYIGETEKNLRKLFDAAEQGGAILFFDEADALFGKRSEVKDSHDRYANIEINYLLQRIEAFSGIAILATNMKSALDAAFMRRLRFIVNFPYPGVTERKQMWEKALAPKVPRDALDFERLARFNLSGGNIQSIALNASFAAALRDSRDGQPQTVTMPLLLTATRNELRKLDKQINDAEFRSMLAIKDAP